MLKRIKLLQGVGSFTSTRASGISLKDVQVIFGENRYGKSTLCDVLYSLAIDNPDLIIDRETIPVDLNNPTKIEIQFDTGNGGWVSLFEDKEWKVKTPDDIDLYIFDQNFIHRNVITGQKLERQNSENVTNFILGEADIEKFQGLAVLNNAIREERVKLRNIGVEVSNQNPQEYANSVCPQKTEEQFESEIIIIKQRKDELQTTINNASNIKNRRLLGYVGQQVDNVKSVQEITSILNSEMQNIHQASMDVFQNHIENNINNDGSFKGWAGQGLHFRKENSCPFCSQHLGNNAIELIQTYQDAFNVEFEQFNLTTREAINNVRSSFSITDTLEHLQQLHQANRDVFEIYSEPLFSSNTEIAGLTQSLEQWFDAIVERFNLLQEASSNSCSNLLPLLEQKYLTPYDSIQAPNFKDLLDISVNYNQSIYEYWQVAEKINYIFQKFKESVDSPEMHTEALEVSSNYDILVSQLARLKLEPTCLNYRTKETEINALVTSYNQEKISLEQSQSEYLESYFRLINELFTQFGSNDFEIKKVQNNRGRQVVYVLNIKFKGQPIPTERISTIFSESDKRALALSIFLAKLLALPTEERNKAVVVMDDPVTSFDNERINLILNKLDEIQRTIKQLIITTHYKGMASKATKKFRRCCGGIKLIQGPEGTNLIEVDNDFMMSSDHDIAFDRIKSFINNEHNENIITELRPFFEEEIRHRFKKQLSELGESKSDLSVCTVALRDNGYLSVDLEARISALRDSLNTPMHELGGDSVENTRGLANQIMDVVYEALNP